MEPIELGQKVKDTVTGLVGIAVARTEWMYGCVRIAVQPQEVKDGKPAESVYIDEPQLEVISQPKRRKPKAAPAGPRPSDPGRLIDRR